MICNKAYMGVFFLFFFCVLCFYFFVFCVCGCVYIYAACGPGGGGGGRQKTEARETRTEGERPTTPHQQPQEVFFFHTTTTCRKGNLPLGIWAGCWPATGDFGFCVPTEVKRMMPFWGTFGVRPIPSQRSRRNLLSYYDNSSSILYTRVLDIFSEEEEALSSSLSSYYYSIYTAWPEHTLYI